MNSIRQFRGHEDADLWDPATLLWTSNSGSGGSEEEPATTWASDALTYWTPTDENTVSFGSYPELEEDEVYSEGVLGDSCANSSGFGDYEEDLQKEEEPEFGDLEEQVQFLEAFTTHSPSSGHVDPAADAPVDESFLEGIAFEFVPLSAAHSPLVEAEGGERGGLALEISSGAFLLTDSVVSTPDVVNDVITLEDEGLLRMGACEDPEEPEDATRMDCDLVMEEFTVEYLDESQVYSTATPGSSIVEGCSASNVNTDFEDDDGDEEYQPPSSSLRTTRTRRLPSCSSAGGEGKKRGRPAKPIRTSLSPRELANLPPEVKQHKVLRFKNNEASRKSRFIRRQKDLKLSEQCDSYESENVDLRRLLKTHNRLHNKLRALVVGIKISL